MQELFEKVHYHYHHQTISRRFIRYDLQRLIRYDLQRFIRYDLQRLIRYDLLWLFHFP